MKNYMTMNQCLIVFKLLYDDLKAGKDVVERKHKVTEQG